MAVLDRPPSPYGSEYRRARARLLSGRPVCWVPECDELATVADHQPPLMLHRHLGEGRGCCRLVPQCAHHSSVQAVELRNGILRTPEADAVAHVDEPAGFDVGSPVWDVPWLEPLRDVPENATWPRLMSPPHPAATGSIGWDFIDRAEARSGRELRWFQRLAAVRALEVDDRERLVWDAVLLTMARQLGKSWWLREYLWDRMCAGDWFREEQTVLHTGKDLSVCKEVQRPARIMAKQDRARFKVREVNGQEEIEVLADGSRWMLRAKTAVYGMSAGLAAVDEAWKVDAEVVDDGITPTMVEREQPQLLLVSTAHRKATSLMLNRRRSALAALDDPGDADLLIEWSAPRDADIADVSAWRMASPHWTPQREKVILAALERALRGEAEGDLAVDEPDPVEAFKSQWLNRWPGQLARQDKGEPLLEDPDRWRDLAVAVEGVGPAVIAVEDWFGKGAACVIVRDVGDGSYLAAGWEFPSRVDAFARATAAADLIPESRLVVGATLADDPAILVMPVFSVTPATGVRTRAGLSLVRELVAAGRLLHDPADGLELDEQVTSARVTGLSTGLSLVPGTRGDLLRALAWAVTVADAVDPVPAVD